MAYVIKDLKTCEYYRQRSGKDGWYDSDIHTARIYGSYAQAEVTIKANGHHVSCPGDRELVIIPITITESVE